ncbi:hypothetical protein L210DRAFT_3506851 [Boletus edulis BED1]|uniref:Uncharacterized protein n=1 Tax=Boletus edulis BED1 TaxID=1328754 RepID=A0AAD4BKV7_BOLED|nr:hypothetical protein L210DRAFT_3506851 [Boletus edulis BED1]
MPHDHHLQVDEQSQKSADAETVHLSDDLALVTDLESYPDSSETVIASDQQFNLVIPSADGDRATWAVDGFDEATRLGSHGPSPEGQLDRTLSTNNFAGIVKGIGRPPRAC